MGRRISKENINLRFNILTLLIYIIGIILIIQLFNLQIIKGEDYRNQSNTRLSRESKLEASRGKILDKTGNILASTKMGFSIELYKTNEDEISYILRTPNHHTGNLISNIAKLCNIKTVKESKEQ